MVQLSYSKATELMITANGEVVLFSNTFIRDLNNI